MIIPDNAPPIPEYFTCYQDNEKKRAQIQYCWWYTDLNGNKTHAVVRYVNPFTDKKETPPITLHEENGKTFWKRKAPQTPHLPYNIHTIGSDKVTIVVEGEKCAELLSVAFASVKSVCVVSWMGGVNAVNKTDWSAIKNRNVLLWPDNDLKCDDSGNLYKPEEQPGIRAMLDVAAILTRQSCTVKIVNVPDDKPDGWDCADAIADGWNTQELFTFIKSNAIEIPYSLPDPEPEPMPELPQEPQELPDYIQELPDTGMTPFKILGFNRDVYYYLPNKTRQVIGFSIGSHSENAFLTLAKLSYWETMYGGKSGVNWKVAKSTLFQTAQSKGVFKPDRIRGVGAYIDRDRVIVNFGTHLLVDGEYTQMTAVDSNFIYEQSTEMYDDLQSPLKNAESAKFLEVMRRLHWETPLNAYYLAGWCVLAPVCGAISWRPHIWLTGIASAGKTWVINSLVKPMITPWVVHVKASVTEAGLRHKLGSDKRPVMVDEFETESQNAQHRAQNVIELARQASSEDDGAIVKGSSNGIAIEYRVNSMFMFSSISVALAQQADENRVSVLTLMDPVTQLDRTQEYKQSHFKDLSSRCAELVNDEYCRGLRARTISLIPIIRKNAKILALAASERLGSTRAGDQYGALLAGAYSLVSDKLITIEKAREWISVNDFTEEERNTESSDSLRCLDLILQHVVRVGSIDFSVAEMLKIVKNVDGESFMCENALLRLGIKYEYDNGSKWIVISNTHKAIGTILRDTSWPKMWGRILKRIHGAVDKKTVRFHDGVRTGAIAIPWNVVYDGD